LVERNLAKVEVASSSLVSRSGIGKIMQYRVNIQKNEEGYSAWVPGLPGCWSEGVDEKDALDNIKDAIKDYLKTADELTKDKETRLVEVE
jgi:predicted RNase H-like HicB family nuclease